MSTEVEAGLERALGDLRAEGTKLLHHNAQRIERGARLELDNYQGWYTRSVGLIRQVVPDRAEEFASYYAAHNGRRAKLPLKDLRIQHYLLDQWPDAEGPITEDLVQETEHAVFKLLRQQVLIVEAIQHHFRDILRDVRANIQKDLFANELDAAKALLHEGHVRPAGAVAGVVLEGWLQAQVQRFQAKIAAQRPTVHDYNEALKKVGAYDNVLWGKIQTLGRVRNLCVHKGEREATREEVVDLIDGVEKLTGKPLSGLGAQARPS